MIGTPYTLQAIADAVGGTLIGPPGAGQWSVDRITIDSRGNTGGASTLFVALQGPRHDGHAYIDELCDAGIRCFLVNADQAVPRTGACLVAVPDTRAALQRFAAHHRERFEVPVIGITGSNGKTVVKEWLWQLLHREEHIVRSPGSWNSQVGVPLSVLRMGPQHSLGVFEAGISLPGEMALLAPIIKPTIGVLTMLGDAHDEGFRHETDPFAKAREKTALFAGSDVWISPGGALPVQAMHQLHGVPHLSWSLVRGAGAPAYLECHAQRIQAGSTILDLRFRGEDFQCRVPFTDEASIANALTCITVCLHLGRSPAWIGEHVPHLLPVDMRLRTVQGRNGSTLLDDSYSLDMVSLASALDHQQRIAQGRRRMVVLSDLPHTTDGHHAYEAVAAHLAEHGIDTLLAVGPELARHRDLFSGRMECFADAASLIANVDPQQFTGAVVLIKGARRFGLEQAVERWQQQVHGTVLEIDLGAVRHNLNLFRAQLQPATRVMAMVKAAGYGTGATELARMLAHERVHYLGVAYADEGIELRGQGISLPIMVMNPEPVSFDTLHRFALEPEVYDLQSLQAAIAYGQHTEHRPVVHVKLDTGMHRLGFQPHDLPALLEALHGAPLHVASILSHLSASEDPRHDAFTRVQLERFRRMADAIVGVLGYSPLRHIANSGAIVRFPEAHFDMVRVGIGLHGIGANDQETALLLPVASLRTVVAQVKDIPAGESIGYGRGALEERPRRIAILPIGYADGFPRRLGHGQGRVHIRGTELRTVGSICMDMCMVEIGDHPCAVGDEVVVFGSAPSLAQYASDLGTIPYEALTSISTRVKRVHLHG
jgi:alanine racemase